MRVFFFVPLEMDFQIPLGRKTIATYVALVGPLSGVRAQVDLQGTVTAKHFGAEPTLMFKKGVFRRGLSVKHRHVRRLSLSVFH